MAKKVVLSLVVICAVNLAAGSEGIAGNEGSRRAHLRGSFDQQLDQLIQWTRMPDDQLAAVPTITAAVQNTLNTRWPGTKVELYGSIASGLALTSSEVAIHVSLPNDTLTEGDILQRAKELFEQFPDHYQHLSVGNMSGTRQPILRMFYVPARQYCHISFMDHSAPYTAKFIRHMLSRDERAMKLAMVVNLWGRQQGVVGPRLLVTTTLVMLVLFWLQSLNILPGVKELQQDVEPLVVNDVGPWNLAFEEKPFASNNNYTTQRLVGEFFQYYGKFDFDKYIISPYCGRPILRAVFQNLKTVANCFEVYKHNVRNNISQPLVCSAICVQDPFVHNISVENHVDHKLRDKIKAKFRVAAKLYEERNGLNFLDELIWGKYGDDVQKN